MRRYPVNVRARSPRDYNSLCHVRQSSLLTLSIVACYIPPLRVCTLAVSTFSLSNAIFSTLPIPRSVPLLHPCTLSLSISIFLTCLASSHSSHSPHHLSHSFPYPVVYGLIPASHFTTTKSRWSSISSFGYKPAVLYTASAIFPLQQFSLVLPRVRL